MDEPELYGIWLGRQLRRKGISQVELANELDVTRAAVSAWITNRATPRPDKMRSIETILGFTSATSPGRGEVPDLADDVRWFHRPAHADGGRELGNAAAFAFDSDLSVLAREATQNSLDERLDAERPVRVRHILHELTGERLHHFLGALRWNDLRPHFQAAAARPQKVGRVLANGLRELEDTGRLLLLRIDDYNASGLIGPEYGDGKFAAVVRRQLDSRKAAGAGGSFGLGKATLWAASQFGLVMMHSTLSRPHEGRMERRLIGRLDLPWRELDGHEYAGPAWLGASDPDREGAGRSWWADEQTVEDLHLTRGSEDPGTSFLIVGAHDASGEASTLEEMHAALVRGLADNFWASMIAGREGTPMLEASVEALRDGRTVVAEERVDPRLYQPARSRAVEAFLNGETVEQITAEQQVAMTTVPLDVPASKSEVDGRQLRHDAVLLVTSAGEEDKPHNHLVCMRGNRMVVVDRNLSDATVGASPMQAVLLAGLAIGSKDSAAERAEEFLRAAEPPEHNDWKRTDDLIATYARGAATRIREFRAAMLKAVSAMLARPEVLVDETPAVLKDLLKLDPPPPLRSPGYPTVKSATGEVGADGAWRIRVEVRLPVRDDPWVMRPMLRFATRSGSKPQVDWTVTAESNCEVSEDGVLSFTTGQTTASFTGLSDITSHPVAAAMAMAEVDLVRAKVENR